MVMRVDGGACPVSFPNKIRRVLAALLLLLTAVSSQLDARTPLPVTPESSVSRTRFAERELAVSPDGRWVAYVTVSPQIEANHNQWDLMIASLAEDSGKPREVRSVLRTVSPAYFANTKWTGKVNSPMSHIAWLDDSRSLVFARQPAWDRDASEICLVDIVHGSVQVLYSSSGSIQEMSLSEDGQAAALFIVQPQDSAQKADMEENGFSVDKRLFITQLVTRNWTTPTRQILIVTNLRSGPPKEQWVEEYRAGGVLQRLSTYEPRVSLSPDGGSLVYTRAAKALRAEWEGTRQFQQSYNDRSWTRPYDAGLNQELTLYTVKTSKKRLAFDHPNVIFERVAWSDDSKWFAVHGPAPLSGRSKATSSSEATAPGLYSVEVSGLAVREVADAAHARYMDDPYARTGTGEVLAWTDKGTRISLRTGATSLATLLLSDGKWRAETSADLQTIEAPYWFGEMRSGRLGTVARLESGEIPPNVYFWRKGKEPSLPSQVTEVSPWLRDLTFGKIETVSLTNKYGAASRAYLVTPPGFSSSRSYPAVLMLKDWTEMFIMDGQWYSTSFPVQALASSGMVVFLIGAPGWQQEPRVGPGAMGYNFNEMATVEAALEELARRKYVDLKRIGISGFSVTSWQTTFILTNSDFPFAAASTGDGFNLNYTSYAVQNLHGNPESWDMGRAFDYMFGGPPYGRTLKNWLEFSPAFNTVKVRAPVLAESCYSDLNAAPALEWFTALHKLGKPVDLYMYPDGQHLLQRPRERVASLRLNLEWFRFWLQGSSGVPPSYDPERFDRWDKLRERHQENLRAIEQGKDPVEEYQDELRKGGWLPTAEHQRPEEHAGD